MVGVEQWAELRREHFVARQVDQGARPARRGCRATRSGGRCAASGRRAIGGPAAGSKLDPFKDEIHRLLGEDPKLPGVRVRELLEPLGCTAGKTVVDDYLREVRPLFAPPPRTFQRTVYRPGEICQFDVWQPRDGGPGRSRPDAPGLGRRRVPGLLARRRRRAGLLQGDAGSAGRDRRLPVAARRRCRETLVWDRQAGIHGHGGRPTRGVRRVLRAAEGRLALLRAGRPAGQGRRRAAAGLRGDELRARPPVSPTSSTSKTSSTPGSRRSTRAPHKTLRARPIDRLAEEHEVMAPLPAAMPDTDRRWVTAGPARPVPALRHQRLLARPAPGRPARRGPRRPARGHRGRAGHRRAGLPPRRGLRPAPHDHRARARPRAAAPAASAGGDRRSRSGRWPATTR